MTRPSNRGGFALIAALWLLLMISTLALEIARSTRERRLAAANFIEAARTSAAARAGLAHAHARVARMIENARSIERVSELGIDPWAALTGIGSDSVSLGQAAYRLSYYDVGAALNLNIAGEDELRRFFVALRVDYGAADRLAQAIMDFRDADEFRHARGAEADDYRRRGLTVVPKNAPFAELDEVRDVLGMTPELFAQALPHITLLGTGRINLNAAPPAVLLTVPGIGDEMVGLLLRYRRQSRHTASLEELANELSTAARRDFLEAMPHLISRTTLETNEVMIHSIGSLSGSPMRTLAEGLAVRSGTTVQLVWSRIE